MSVTVLNQVRTAFHPPTLFAQFDSRGIGLFNRYASDSQKQKAKQSPRAETPSYQPLSVEARRSKGVTFAVVGLYQRK